MARWPIRYLRYLHYTLFFLMTAFALLSCRSPEIRVKPYLGFTPLPYDLPTEPGVELITYGFLVYRGTLIAHHLDEGVPWQQSYAGMPFPDSLEHDIQTRLENTTAAQKVYLAVTPIAKPRNELAANWGEQFNQSRTGEWATRDFDSPEVKIAYLNYCRRMIQRFNPDSGCG